MELFCVYKSVDGIFHWCCWVAPDDGAPFDAFSSEFFSLPSAFAEDLVLLIAGKLLDLLQVLCPAVYLKVGW